MTAEYYNVYTQGKAVPNFDRSEFSIFDPLGALYHELELYNPGRRSSIIRKRGTVHDILEFHKYRREHLTHLEQTLKWDAESIKIENTDVLKEYKFLHHAIKMVCPLIFEPADAELQREIVHDDLAKDGAAKELSKKLGAVYTGNAYDYNRKKRVRNKTFTYYNRITGRQTEAKSVYEDLNN